MANGILVKLDDSQHASVFVLASLVLLIAQMPLLMGANIVFSALVVWVIWAQISTPRAAAHELQTCNSLPWSKVVSK